MTQGYETESGAVCMTGGGMRCRSAVREVLPLCSPAPLQRIGGEGMRCPVWSVVKRFCPKRYLITCPGSEAWCGVQTVKRARTQSC
jgi:hypothetical protein